MERKSQYILWLFEECNLEFFGQHPESLKKDFFGVVLPTNTLK